MQPTKATAKASPISRRSRPASRGYQIRRNVPHRHEERRPRAHRRPGYLCIRWTCLYCNADGSPYQKRSDYLCYLPRYHVERRLPKGTSNLTILKTQLEAAAKDRNGDAKREKATMIHMLPEKLEDAPADMPSAFRDFAEYYRTPRGIHPRAPNVALSRTRDLMTTYDAFHFNTMIALRPLLMIAGTKAETRDYSVDSLKMAEEPKELFGIEGKTHADLYDDYEGGLPKLVEFFEGFLAK